MGQDLEDGGGDEDEEEEHHDSAILESWDRKIHSDRLSRKYSGAYYRFETFDRVVSEGHDDLDGSDADIKADTPCILTSCSKIFAGTAVMRTMHLRPDDWYPEKPMHEFAGWEEWRDFPVWDDVDDSEGKPVWSGRIAPQITVHHLLTHTSGWPFGLQGTRERILNMPLYFMPGNPPGTVPGEYFGYSIGHRILGWMLLDYWKLQPEGHNFRNLNDIFDFLIYRPLGMTGTKFIEDRFHRPHSLMGRYYRMQYFDTPGKDDPADLALESTGMDMAKLAMMALQRGRLKDGSVYIGKWDEWAAKNKLPGNKLSNALTHWRMEGHDDLNCLFFWRTMLTRTVNAGPFGWSYFGATYHDVPADWLGDAGPAVAVGWKGFSSCGLRADYVQNIAFVAMQECVPDPGNRNFAQCIHEGKVGKFKLIDVAEELERTSPEVMTSLRKRYPKRGGLLHDVLTEVDDPGLLLRGMQNVICFGYACALPFGARVLRFHKHEELGEEHRDLRLLPDHVQSATAATRTTPLMAQS